MLNKSLLTKITFFNYFLLKIFKISTFSYYYIKFIFLIFHHYNEIFSIFFRNYSFLQNYNSIFNKIFIFKRSFFNKKNYYKNFVFKNIKDLGLTNLTIRSSSINSYIIQKNFSFYYNYMYSKTYDIPYFIISLNIKKVIFTMMSFKIILFNLYFYNVKVIVWGTKEFTDEINSSNELFSIKSFNKICLDLLINLKIFTNDVTYNLRINFFFRDFSLVLKRNLVFIVLQNTGNGAFILNRFKYFSFGCLTNLKLKHNYSFLIPIHIKSNYSKFYIYSFITSYKNIVIKYQLMYFLLYYFKYKIFLKLAFITQR